MNNIEKLRKDCKRLMVELDIDFMGSREPLAHAISTDDDTVNKNSLGMALTGYRNISRSLELLQRLNSYLSQQLESTKQKEVHREQS